MIVDVFDISKDLNRVMEMSRDMHAKSLFSALELNENKVLRMFMDADEGNGNPYYFRVVRDNGVAIAFMVAVAGAHFCSDDLYSIDLLIWVDVDYRGTEAGALLRDGYSAWADEIGVTLCMIGSTTGINMNRSLKFFQAGGFELVGHNLVRS